MQKELGENLFFPRNHRGAYMPPPTWNKLYQSPRGIGLTINNYSKDSTPERSSDDWITMMITSISLSRIRQETELETGGSLLFVSMLGCLGTAVLF